MKKLIFPLIVLIAIVAAAVPSIFGLKAEDVYREKVSGLTIPGIVSVEVLSYERGWLKSRAQVLLQLEAGGAALMSSEVRKLTTYLVQDTIHHGPFTLGLGEFATRPSPPLAMAVVDSALFFDEEPEFYRALFGQAPLLLGRTTVGFSGQMQSTAVSQPTKAEIQSQGATLNWKGLVLNSALKGQELNYTARGDGLSISAQGVDFELLAWREEGQLTLHGGPITGDVKGSMDGATAMTGANSLLSFDGLSYEKSTRMTDGLMTGETSMTIAPTTVMGETYGPAVLKFDASNIAAEELTQLIYSFNKTVAEQPLTALEGNEGSEPEDLIGLLSEDDSLLLIEALRASPRVALSELSFKTVEGETTGSASAGFEGEGLAQALASQDLIERVYAEWSFEVPLELVIKLAATTPEVQQQALSQLMANNPNAFPTPEEMAHMTRELSHALIDSLTQQGYLLISPQTLTFSGSLKGGALTVGTQELPLGD